MRRASARPRMPRSIGTACCTGMQRGEYYSRIDLGDLTFGPDDADASVAPVDGEYSYDIENLFQAAEQLYGSIGDGDVSGLNDSHPVTFVYYEKQTDGSMKEVGRAEDAFTYSYTTG